MAKKISIGKVKYAEAKAEAEAEAEYAVSIVAKAAAKLTKKYATLGVKKSAVEVAAEVAEVAVKLTKAEVEAARVAVNAAEKAEVSKKIIRHLKKCYADIETDSEKNDFELVETLTDEQRDHYIECDGAEVSKTTFDDIAIFLEATHSRKIQ